MESITSFYDVTEEKDLPAKALQLLILDRAVELEIVQERPYTMVRIRSQVDGTEHIVCGFSKVKWPDAWAPQLGINVARLHAARVLARKIKGIQKDFSHQR